MAFAHHQKPPFYESNLFYFLISSAIAFLLLVIAKLIEVRWLLFIVWIFTVAAIYQATATIARDYRHILRFVCAVILAAALYVLGYYVIDTTTFRVTYVSSFRTPMDRPGSYQTPFFVRNNAGIITPITALLHVNIVNKTDTPDTITGYSLEYSANREGPWITLCKVFLLSNSLFFAPAGLAHSQEIRLSVVPSMRS